MILNIVHNLFSLKSNTKTYSNLLSAIIKVVCFLLFLFTFINSNATNYYLSNAGNDENSGTQQSSSWKTLEKLNSFKNLWPGDSVLFKRGDTFYGKITLTNTYGNKKNFGSAGNPIVFSAYGSGEKPIITGFTSINLWTSLGGNIWESTIAVPQLSNCNMVAVNDVNTPMGRYPNTGWKKIPTSTKTSITDNSLPAKNWTGGEIVTRVERPVTNKYLVTSQSGKTIHFTNKEEDGYGPRNKWGYFIQNHSGTLDIQNEWYFNSSTKKLRIYSNSKPQNVKITTVDTLVTILITDFLTFDNIHFSGANQDIFVIGSSKNITVQNCDFNFAGENAIWGKNFWKDFDGDSLRIISNSFRNTNNYGIFLENEKKYAYIGHNSFDQTAMIAGASASGDAKGVVIMSTGNSSIIEYNRITNSGYTAIYFQGNGTIVQNNFIDNFCVVKDDGGGIYTWIPTIEQVFHGMKILDNVILNGIGNLSGVDDGSQEVWCDGIYLDIRSSFIEVAGNTIAKCNRAGIFPYRGEGNNIHHNLCYDNKYGIRFQDDLGTVSNDTIKENFFISKYTSQFPGDFNAPHNNISTFGIFDSNYYSKPIDRNVVISISTGNGSNYRKEMLTLANWQQRYKLDLHSKQSTAEIAPFSYVPVHANKFSNGSFNSNIEGISSWSANTNLIASWNNKKLNGGTLQLSYSKASSKNTSPNISVPIGDVNQKNKYILKFSTIGSINNKTIYVSLKNTAPNWDELTPLMPVVVNTSRSDDEILFSFPKSKSSAAVTFTWNDKDLNDTFWIDNVALFEANVSETNLNDFFLFEYNASIANKAIILKGNYKDVTGKSFSGNITLAPFTSIVLIKDKGIKK